MDDPKQDSSQIKRSTKRLQRCGGVPAIDIRRERRHRMNTESARSVEYDLQSIWHRVHNTGVGWTVEIADEFHSEFSVLEGDVKTEILALSKLLQQFGPQLGRPRVDTLKGSRHANMKELRFSASGGEWRVAFAFDPKRRAILLVAGDKSGVGQRSFYRELIRKADNRFDAHLVRLKSERKK
jgi:hypothetical protein